MWHMCLRETYREATAWQGNSEREGYQDGDGGRATKDISTPFSKFAAESSGFSFLICIAGFYKASESLHECTVILKSRVYY